MPRIARKKKKLTADTLTIPRDYSLVKDGITQSLITKFLTCRKSFLFAINKLTGGNKAKTTNFGSLCHFILADLYGVTKKQMLSFAIDASTLAYYKEENPNIDAQQKERDSGMAGVVMQEYIEFYKKDFERNKYDKTEQEFNLALLPIRRRGKIDGGYLTIKKPYRRWLVEHKTKGRVVEDALVSHLSIDFQNLYYITNYELDTGETVSGMLYDVIRNPQIKQGKNQSFKDFCDRVQADIKDRPDFYFMRWEVPYTKKDKLTFKNELIRIEEDIQFACVSENFYKNTTACLGMFTCEYLHACTTNNLDCLTKKEKLFSELE